MTASRRNFLMGAAALSAAVITPETVRAMTAMRTVADWGLATADIEADVAPAAMRLVHGRAPVGLEGVPDGYKAMYDREALKVMVRP